MCIRDSIIGPNLTYDFSQYNDLGSSNSNNKFAIYNDYNYGLVYFSYLTDTNGTNYYSIPSSYLNIYRLNLFTGFSFYTSKYEPYNLTPYVYNDSLALLYLYNSTNLSIKDIIFSNTYWYIFNTEKYYNSNNMIFWNTSQPYYGFVLNSTNFYNKIFNLNNLYNGYLYYYYENGVTLIRRYQICTTTTTCGIGCIQITTCNTYYLHSILYTNYNPCLLYTSDAADE